MNINQLARTQQLMYNFVNKNSDYASQIQTQFSGLDTLNSANSGKTVDADSLLQQMGMSGLQGRTVREMARYKLEQEQTQATQQSTAGLDAALLTQQFSVRTMYTPISDEATEAMQGLALQDAINSVGTVSASDANERVALIQKHLESVAPSKRMAAFNTMNKVWESELDRIGEYIKEHDPEWTAWGDKFDASILENYEPGLNIWV